MSLRAVTMACLVLGLLTVATVLGGVPTVAPVPPTLPETVRQGLETRSQALRQQYAALVAKNDAFAAQYGNRDIPKGSPEAQAALQAMAELKAAMDKYAADVEKFNKDVQAAGQEAKATPTSAKAPAATGKALSWEDGHPERKAWSDELRSAIKPNLGRLEMAEDIDKFAPNYKSLSESRQIDVWAALFVAIACYESEYNPHSILKETSGQDSVGLLQLSYENQAAYDLEPLDRKAKSLEDPLVNLRCGVKILAHWVEKDHVIAAGSSLKDGRGGARYWSNALGRPPPRRHSGDGEETGPGRVTAGRSRS